MKQIQIKHIMTIVLGLLLALPTWAEGVWSVNEGTVRQSGTEPVVRIMVELGSLEECDKYIEAIYNVT